MAKVTSLLALAVGLLLGSNSAPFPQGERAILSDDSAILSSVIDNLDLGPDRGYLVIEAETRLQAIDNGWLASQFSVKNRGAAAPNWDELLADYKKRNSRDHSLCCLASAMPVKLVARQDLERVFSAGEIEGWKRRFPKEFPGAAGMLQLSLPGYSKDRTWAVTCAFLTRGVLYGEQRVVVLRRAGNAWAVEWSGVAAFT